MPIYEYCCSSCGAQKDVMQRMSDAPLEHCPVCARATFSKQISAAGFQLKGSGWYVTDFKNSGSKPPAKVDAPASSAIASGSSPAAGSST